MTMKSTLLTGLSAAAIFALGISAASAAGEHVAPMQEVAKSKVSVWVNNPAVVNAVKAQNAKNAGLAETDIIKLDKTWRAEVKKGGGALTNKVISNALSSYLKTVKNDSQGLFTEIFVMDNKGLNVGQSDMTSDFWQGDEAKWQKTYKVGPQSMHIGSVKTDESSQTLQSQLSVPVVDPASGEVIGAVTVGVNVEQLN